jgi:hypothetical protein
VAGLGSVPGDQSTGGIEGYAWRGRLESVVESLKAVRVYS